MLVTVREAAIATAPHASATAQPPTNMDSAERPRTPIWRYVAHWLMRSGASSSARIAYKAQHKAAAWGSAPGNTLFDEKNTITLAGERGPAPEERHDV